jgi:hypothetical protein
MNKIKQIFGISVTSLGLVAGLAGGIVGAAPSMNTTGPNSKNIIKSDTSTKIKVTNDNDLGVKNRNTQNASTGKAEAEHNTTAGSATAGDASNTNNFSANVSVSNSSPSAATITAGGSGTLEGSISTTGPNSTNVIKAESESYVRVNNDNDLHVYNTSKQTAKSGNAEVEGNTTAGSATTGDASNDSTTSLTFTVSN